VGCHVLAGSSNQPYPVYLAHPGPTGPRGFTPVLSTGSRASRPPGEGGAAQGRVGQRQAAVQRLILGAQGNREALLAVVGEHLHDFNACNLATCLNRSVASFLGSGLSP
jgi:hypothetical protein